MKNILTKIKNEINDFSKTERKYLKWVLENTEKAIDFSSRKSAEESKTSAPTIVRAIKKLGFSKYSEFQIELAVSKNNTVDNFEIDKTDGFLKIYKKIVSKVNYDYETVSEIINDNQFEVFIKKLINCKMVEFECNIKDIKIDKNILYDERIKNILKIPSDLSEFSIEILLKIIKERLIFQTNNRSMIK